MEKAHPLLPEKASSFSGREEKKVCEPSRNLSLTSTKSDAMHNDTATKPHHPPTIDEEPNDGSNDDDDDDDDDINPRRDLASISSDIDSFIDAIQAAVATRASVENVEGGSLPDIPKTAVSDLAVMVEEVILRLDAGVERPAPLSLQGQGGDFSLLESIDRISKLTTALGAFPSEASYGPAMSRTASVLQRAMAFLEEEFRSLLEDHKRSNGHEAAPPLPTTMTDTGPPSDAPAVPPSSDAGPEPATAIYTKEVVERLRRIAGTMISAGYETECCQVFSITRRASLTAGLAEVGFERTSSEEVEKMAWESLEGEVATWISAFRRSVSVSFSHERHLCEAVFAGHPAVATGLFSNLARGVVIQLLNFAEAVTGTKRSGEKLFKFLDMYETMRDLMPVIDGLFPSSGKEGTEQDGDDKREDGSTLPSSLLQAELKSELSAAKGRIGDAVVGIFSDLESSIRSDNGKTPVPGGAVHPLTRYVMNYLKYACEYKSTLEQLFQENHDRGKKDEEQSGSGSGTSPFSRQLMGIMDLLDQNLEAKSRLYKDQSLSYIFLMNNGRYIVQKIKGWAEINELLGDQWCRRRSSELRQHHKNYQRETWGRVLGCFKDEGLQAGGSKGVSKAAVKERFKLFNATFEEIHKAQSNWVVSDEQLQSELRVSVSAVVVPAYRSFLGRYRQYLEGGRGAEKYIKYGPDDLEACIDELFDGNPASMAKRKT